MLNPELDIYLLRAFVAVAEEKSFTRAAFKLNRTQSAVSMQVRRLEQSLGRRLLIRNRKQVRLSEDGESLFDYARRILSLNDEALSEMGQPEIRGKVRLGIPDDYAAYFLPRVLAKFKQLYPQVRLEVSCALSVNLPGMLRAGEIDLALTTRQPKSQGGLFLRKEQLVWAQTENSLLHEQVPLPLALFPEGVCVFREAALKALTEAGLRWRIVCTSSGLAGIRSVVSSGMAITVVTENTLSQDMVVIGPESQLPQLPEIEIALHKQERPENEAVEAFAAHLQECLRD